MFVDDDPDFIDLLKHKAKGIQACFVYTGAEALMQIKYNRFDVVVLDYDMFIDGVTLVKLSNGRLRSAKVYFLTGCEKSLVAQKAIPIKEKVCGIYDKLELDLLIENLKGKNLQVA